MLLFVYNGSDNVASAAQTVCAPRCATEICHLICDQMEIVDLAAGGAFAHVPVLTDETPRNPNLFRMGRQPSVP